jgi:hypothetical protein
MIIEMKKLQQPQKKKKMMMRMKMKMKMIHQQQLN